MSEYKEFWIQASNMIAHDDKPPIAKQLFHVIEYEAFEKLKKQNEIMREALSFYADIERWKTVEHCELKSKIRIDAADFDAKIDNDMMYFIAGKRARQALKDVKDVEVWDEKNRF